MNAETHVIPGSVYDTGSQNESEQHMGIRDFSDRSARELLQKELKENAVESAHVRRNAGSGLHDVALGAMSYDDLKRSVLENPDSVFMCIDEHCDHVDGHGIVTAHAGCGAAEGIYSAVAGGNSVVIDNLSKIFGDDWEAIGSGIKNNTLKPDDLGTLWSEKLARDTGLEFQFIGVKRFNHGGHEVHSATGASVHTNPDSQANWLPGESQEKPFIVTNPNKEVNEQGLDIMARQAALAAKIAQGGHGIMGERESKFAIMVQGDLNPEQKAVFNSAIEKYGQQFGTDLAKVTVIYEESAA